MLQEPRFAPWIAGALAKPRCSLGHRQRSGWMLATKSDPLPFPYRSNLDAAVEPVHFPRVLRVAPGEQVVAQVARGAAAVDDVPENPGRNGHPRGAQIAFPLVGEERGVDIGARLLEFAREHHGVFDRHARALRERSEERRVGKECRSRWSPY